MDASKNYYTGSLHKLAHENLCQLESYRRPGRMKRQFNKTQFTYYFSETNLTNEYMLLLVNGYLFT